MTKYSKKAAEKVEKTMHEMKEGHLIQRAEQR